MKKITISFLISICFLFTVSTMNVSASDDVGAFKETLPISETTQP
ncbi:hypothetical protein [Bacillus sp. FJAT-45037]|nr:hypothetical protein [Bacillus sp. FJAT-45037]